MAEEGKVPGGAEAQAHSGAEHHAHEHSKEGALSRYKGPIIALILYLAVALVMFYPLVLHMGSTAPGTGADTYQNLWDIWWSRYAVFNLHTNVFYTYLLFWPVGANLAFATIAPLNGIIYAPFELLGTVFAYNVMFLMGFALSGLTMYILADYLTRNRYAAIVAGFVFTFSAFHIAQSYSHIHFINIEWVPLVIYFFLRIVNERRNYLNIIGMGVSFALTTLMGNIEQTLMLAMALVILAIIFLIYEETRKRILTLNFAVSIVLFVAVAFVAGAWNFVPLLNAVTHSGGLGIANYLNTAAANSQWSISPAGFFIPSYYNGIIYASGIPASIYNSVFAPDPVEKVGYIGYAVIALVLFAIYKYRKDMLPWAICAVIFVWLALGPSFGLYSIYHAIPALNVIREPGRFDLIATLFIAIMASYGAKALFEMLGSEHHGRGADMNRLYMVLVVLLAIMFVENNGLQLGKSPQVTTSIAVPQLYSSLANVTGNFSILTLPTLPEGPYPYYYPGIDTFYTSITHKPIVGGYVGGRQNLTSTLLIYNLPLAVQASTLASNGSTLYQSPILQNYTNQSILTLYNYGTEFVIVHKDAYNSSSLQLLEGYLLSVFGSPVYNDNTTAAFSTENAIGQNIFRSFVSYPLLSEWNPVSVFLNGSYQTYWESQQPGSVTVYAPYPYYVNNTNFNSKTIYYVNGTIGLDAISNVNQGFEIAEPSSSSSSGIKVIAAFNITGKQRYYTANTTFVSGPVGNELYFLYQSNSTPVLINNVTISRRK